MKKFAQLISMAIMLLASLQLTAQERTITGSVLSDEGGTPLEGVTVTNQRTKRSTTTNAVGFFSVLGSRGDVLTFTYVGFTASNVTISNEAAYSIRLSAAGSQLSDVVVTAHGITRNKKSLGYSTPIVEGDEVTRTQRENFINGLAGRVPGLQVNATSGQPELLPKLFYVVLFP
jgi:hypothetical protein